MNPQLFRHIWKCLCKAYKLHSHCFVQGSSSYTISEWVRKATFSRIKPKDIKRALAIAEDKGWAKSTKSADACTKWWLNCGNKLSKSQEIEKKTLDEIELINNFFKNRGKQ